MPPRSAPAPPPQQQQAPQAADATPTFTSFPISPSDALTVRVGDPQRVENHVTYAISTTTILDSYAASAMVVRRRFQDFVWLQRRLGEDFPFAILPPLPDKHRMEYFTGDRFAPEFLERRRLGLQHYLDRVTRHPVLQTSPALKAFLEEQHLVGIR